MARSYHDMFRPAYELPACATWAASSLAMSVLHPPMWPAIAVGMLAASAVRGKQAVNLYRFRASISALRVEKMSVGDMLTLSRKHLKTGKKLTETDGKGGFFLGRGFRWTQHHAEVARQILYRSPDEIQGPPAWLPKPLLKSILPPNHVPLKDDAVGVTWIHGLHPDEDELSLPIEALAGHTLVVGTTRAGKTRLYELLTTQIVHANKVLIIIDPKGDKDWEKRVREECQRAGRKFLYFHPAHPSKSIRMNPLANWNTVSEAATRIGQLIDADGSFGAFAWKTLARVMRAQVADGARPTIKSAKEYVQNGVEPLLDRLIEKKLYALQGPTWANDLKSFVPKPTGNNKTSQAGNEKLESMIAKYQSLHIEDEAISSLIAMVHHSKEHYSKMIQVLEPILEMLGGDELGAMLSPDPLDMTDQRPIYDTHKIIEEKAVLYVGLDSLSNKIIGSAVGSILLADMASVAGAIYNFREPEDIYMFIDEAAEVMNEQGIQLLNKGGGAGIKAFIATQTIADFDVVFGNNARTGQALGNLNNVICLRVKDPEMAKWIATSFGQTAARDVRVTHSTGSGSSTSFTEFSGSTSQSMSETEIPFVSPDLLTRLPGLQYFAFLAGSTLFKGRLPLLQ